MPVIHVHYIFDLTAEQKKNLTADMTAAVAKNMNVPPQHVQIWMHQTSARDHSVGGVILEEMLQEKENA